MAFTLWSLYKSGLLFINGVAVLHRKRFLRKCTFGEGMTQSSPCYIPSLLPSLLQTP